MKRSERVERIVLNARTFDWGMAQLDFICNHRGCDAKCETCCVAEGKDALAAKFGVKLPKEEVAPKVNVTINGNVTIKVHGNATIRWIERK